MLNVVLVYILSFSGILFGKILRKLAFEEIKTGGRYLIKLQYSLLFVLAVFLVYYSKISYWLVLFFLLGFLLSFIFRKRYFYLGLALAASSIIPKLFIISSSIIFIYGLSFGSTTKNIVFSLLFFAIGIILSLLYLQLSFNADFLLYFIAGSLFLRY